MKREEISSITDLCEYIKLNIDEIEIEQSINNGIYKSTKVISLPTREALIIMIDLISNGTIPRIKMDIENNVLKCNVCGKELPLVDEEYMGDKCPNCYAMDWITKKQKSNKLVILEKAVDSWLNSNIKQYKNCKASIKKDPKQKSITLTMTENEKIENNGDKKKTTLLEYSFTFKLSENKEILLDKKEKERITIGDNNE